MTWVVRLDACRAYLSVMTEHSFRNMLCVGCKNEAITFAVRETAQEMLAMFLEQWPYAVVVRRRSKRVG